MITKLATDRGGEELAERGLHKLVAQAWSDPAFKAKLLAQPVAALAAAGVAMPTGVTVKVFENTDKLVHLVLPPPPAEDELSDEALDKVGGGWCCCCESPYPDPVPKGPIGNPDPIYPPGYPKAPFPKPTS
jgi:hypothetical protein